ncbi:MAG: hypothetical protein WCF15_10060, partial [Pseudolabrys sp.]
VGACPYNPLTCATKNLLEIALGASKLLPTPNRLEAENHIDAKSRVNAKAYWRARTDSNR